MAIVTAYSAIAVAATRQRLARLRRVSDIYSPEVTVTIRRLRGDTHRQRLLEIVRFDPADEDAWQRVAGPVADRDEIAASHRLMLLLVADAEPVAETSAPPSLGKALFSTLGWPEDLAELASNGQPIVSLLDVVCPQLAADIPGIAPWVMGGWLGGAPLAGLRARLQSDLQAMGRPIKEVADRLSLEMSLDRRHLEDQIRAGQTALRTAVAVVPDDAVIWLVRD